MKTLRVVLGVLTIATAATLTPVLGVGAGSVVVKDCSSTQLGVRVGMPQGTAGTIYYPIVITNRGATCGLWGVPQIQPVIGGPDHRRVPVGPPARNVSMGQMPVRHVLVRGQSASDAFGVSESGNYPPSTCRATTARAIVVTLSPFVAPRLLGLMISVCTHRPSTTTRLLTPGVTGD